MKPIIALIATMLATTALADVAIHNVTKEWQAKHKTTWFSVTATNDARQWDLLHYKVKFAETWTNHVDTAISLTVADKDSPADMSAMLQPVLQDKGGADLTFSLKLHHAVRATLTLTCNGTQDDGPVMVDIYNINLASYLPKSHAANQAGRLTFKQDGKDLLISLPYGHSRGTRLRTKVIKESNGVVTLLYRIYENPDRMCRCIHRGTMQWRIPNWKKEDATRYAVNGARFSMKTEDYDFLAGKTPAKRSAPRSTHTPQPTTCPKCGVK